MCTRPALSSARQGEGRAAAQARPLLLGEALPPLRLSFRDGAGNAADGPQAAAGVALEALSGPVHSGGAVVPDLRVTADVKVWAMGDSRRAQADKAAASRQAQPKPHLVSMAGPTVTPQHLCCANTPAGG